MHLKTQKIHFNDQKLRWRESHEGNFGETEREDPRELEAKEMSKSSLKAFRRRPEHGLKTAMRNKENLVPSPGLGVESRGTGGT